MLQTNTDLVIVLICTVQRFTLAVNISGAHINCDKVVEFPTSSLHGGSSPGLIFRLLIANTDSFCQITSRRATNILQETSNQQLHRILIGKLLGVCMVELTSTSLKH